MSQRFNARNKTVPLIQARKLSQRTLHDFFVPDARFQVTPGRTNFHDLPYHIRRRIYHEAELRTISEDIIYLNYLEPEDICRRIYSTNDLSSLPEQQVSQFSRSISHYLDGPLPPHDVQLNRRCKCFDPLTKCFCGNFPYQLLYVSKVVRRDAKEQFFSGNRFSICRSDLGGLSGLFSLPYDALALLTSLSISLNVIDCAFGCWGACGTYCLLRDCHSSCKTRGHDETYYKPKPGQRNVMLGEWTKLCRYLGKCVQSNRLRFWLTCNVSDVEAGKEIISPLLKYLPMLRECGISFGVRPYNRLLGNLARETTMKLTGRLLNDVSPDGYESMDAVSKEILPQKSFRWMELPQEIKLQILSFTELVTPYDIAWNLDGLNGVSFFEYRALPDREYRSLPGHEYHRTFQCCRECSDARDVFEACHCWARCNACSSTCTCWRMPELFLVSHKMREDAAEIFYSRNHFVVVPHFFVRSPWRRLRRKHSELHEFLMSTSLSAIARQHLRYITWILPPDGAALPMPGSPSYFDWLEIVDICARDMNLWNLTIVIDMSVNRPAHNMDSPANQLDSGALMVKTMAEHEGWKDVFFFLNWAHDWDGLSDWDYIKRKQRLRKQEADIEKSLMGEEYNAIERGKCKRRHRWNGRHGNSETECQTCDEFYP